jgi:hypothetical protein
MSSAFGAGLLWVERAFNHFDDSRSGRFPLVLDGVLAIC